MDSANFYELQEQQLDSSFPCLAAQSTHGVAALHQYWNPSLHPNNDEYNHYMNETLAHPKEVLGEKAHFMDMGYCDNEYESCGSRSTNGAQINVVDLNENLWLGTSSLSSNEQICLQQLSAYSSNNNYALNNMSPNCSSNLGSMSSTSPEYSTPHQAGLNLGIDFISYLNNSKNCSHSSQQHLSLSNYDLNSSSSGTYNKTSTSRNIEAVSPAGTKRVSNSSQRRPSYDGAAKKPRAVSQSSCPLPKVGKEKIGDRIAALHKLVAPFGKTDTASVLTEAIGYIQFLQDQIQTLSTPCKKPSHSDPRRCFKGVLRKQDHKELEANHQDLRSRGLCLVPLSFASCTGLGGI